MFIRTSRYPTFHPPTCLKFSSDINRGYPSALIISVRYLKSRNDMVSQPVSVA